ncbi:MAG: FAD-dependent oxidoreductase [Candidatus Eisenbacteria bacterium]
MDQKAGTRESGTGKPVGAVLVVGGGVAGMQATLDLVNSGYRVYLVEKAPGIGGKMAQLDKTFPTNDCSMCIVSPKLVEVGRHKDVELLTHTEVTSISGKAGDFRVKIRRHARYVDEDKCTGCGMCEEYCPVLYKPYFPAADAQGKAQPVLAERETRRLPFRGPHSGPAPEPWTYTVAAEKCGKCGACFKACPADAITWAKGEPAAIDQSRCITCGACHVACPPKFDAIVRGAIAEIEQGFAGAVAKRSLRLKDAFAGQPDHDCVRCGLCVQTCHELMGAGALKLKRDGIEVSRHLCRACGACVSICPVGFLKIEELTPLAPQVMPDPFDEGLGRKKPIKIYYPQVVPRIPVIDPESCVHLRTGGCGVCSQICGVNAIDYAAQPREIELRVGAVVLAPGGKEFEARLRGEYGYGIYDNVVTAIQFERMLSASGPTTGHLFRPSDHRDPKRIAWIQCVGSRDRTCEKDYCSSVCCMYASKEAVIAKEHDPEVAATIFFIDLRAFGKGFDEYVTRAQEQHGIRYVRSMVSRIFEDPVTRDLTLRYIDEQGERREETFDLVVLSVGFQIPAATREMAARFDLALDRFGFAETSTFEPLETSRPGVFACGIMNGPKDIPETVMEAGGAAGAVSRYLAGARGTLTREAVSTPEAEIPGDAGIRIGVFVCHCGRNIGGVVDVPGAAEYALTLPNVVHAADTLYACSMDAQELLAKAITQHRLNRVVVAACSPKTHEPLFQETMEAAGLNKYLFEFANIRNHVSWVHKDEPARATEKAKDLIRMAVAKVSRAEALEEARLDIEQNALVIGGGIAGMTAARTLAAQGYPVHLVERESQLGGQANRLHRTWRGEDIPAALARMKADIAADPRITVYTGTELTAVDGFVGNFSSTLTTGGRQTQIRHGVAVVATGAGAHVPNEYLYGEHPAVLTHQELDQRLIARDPGLANIRAAAFIQCVGSREPQRTYCSRVCCTHSLEAALALKELNPDMDVYVLYRDIRSYGLREMVYEKARRAGVKFIRFDVAAKPQVTADSEGLLIRVPDPALRQTWEIRADLLTLAAAIVPYGDEKLAQMFKVPLTEQGFFLEAHVKLGPSEFATDGVFLCGLAHYPKGIDESITQARAAASRATTLLARRSINISGTVAYVDPRHCSSCGVCVEVCPYSAPGFLESGPWAGKSQINPILCKGCGLCVAACRSNAIFARGFSEEQIIAQIEEAFI